MRDAVNSTSLAAEDRKALLAELTREIREFRLNEALIIGKPTYSPKYEEQLKGLLESYKMTKKEFTERFYDKKLDQGTVFDLRFGSQVVFTERGEESMWFVRYKDDQKRLVTEGLRDGYVIFREITPFVAMIIEYDADGVEKGAVTLWSKHKLAQFRSVDSEEEIKEAYRQKEVREFSGWRYELPFILARSEIVDYDTISQKSHIELLREHLKREGLDTMEDDLGALKWVKITYLTPAGKEWGYSYQAFGDSSLPFVQIIGGKIAYLTERRDVGELVDIVVKRDNKIISLRFDLDRAKPGHDSGKKFSFFEPVAVSQYSQFPTHKLVVDLYKQLIFIDVRDEETGFWAQRLHLLKNGTFGHDWRWIVDNLDLIAQNRQDRMENFNYQEDMFSSMLKALDISLSPETVYLQRTEDGTKTIMVGKGELDYIDWDNGVIISRHKVILHREDGTEKLVYYRTWRNFRGDVVAQFLFKDHSYDQPTLGIYVYDPDKYGIGDRSLTFLNMNRRWVLFSFAEFDSIMDKLRLKDIKGREYISRLFFFDVTKVNQAVPMNEFDEDSPVGAYGELKNRMPDFKDPDLIASKHKTGRGGDGRNVIMAHGYRYDTQGNLIGNPEEVVFNLHDYDVSGITEAGTLDLGYGKEAYSYRFDEGAGFHSSLYARPRVWTYLKFLSGHAPDAWLDSGWRGRAYDRNLDGDFMTYLLDYRRDDRKFMKKMYLHLDGRTAFLTGEYQKILLARGQQGTLLDKYRMETTVYNELEQPLYSILTPRDIPADKLAALNADVASDLEGAKKRGILRQLYTDIRYSIDDNGLMNVISDVEEKEALSGGRKPKGWLEGLKTFFSSGDENREHEGVWHLQRYLLVNGNVPENDAKKRIGLMDDYRTEPKTLALIVFLGIFGSLLVTWVAAWAFRAIGGVFRVFSVLRRRSSEKPVKGEATGERLVESYGFTPDEEKLSDYLVVRAFGEYELAEDILAGKRGLGGMENHEIVHSGKLKEFIYWYTHYAPVKPQHPKSVKFTLADLRLYERVFNIMGNERHSPAFTYFLFYLAWNMAHQPGFSYTSVGPELKAHRDRFDAVLRNQTALQGPRVTTAGKSLDSYYSYDDLDDLFRTPGYVKAYMEHYYPGIQQNWSGSSPVDELPDHLKPYKTYHEIAGGRFNRKGMMQVAINTLPKLVYEGTLLAVVIGVQLGYGWFPLVVAAIAAIWATLRLFEWHWQKPNDAMSRYGRPRPSYHKRKIPRLSRNDISNILFWIAVSAVKLAWNYFIIGYFIDATFALNVLDPVSFPAILSYFSWLNLIFFGAAYLFIQARMDRQQGFVRDYLNPLGVLTGIIGVWWVFGSVVGGLLAGIMLWVPFLYFFYLSTFALVQLGQALIGFGRGVYDGKIFINKTGGRIRRAIGTNRRQLRKSRFRNEFVRKSIPAEVNRKLTEEQRDAAFAYYWNTIVRVTAQADGMSPEEVERYTFGLDLEEERGPQEYLKVEVPQHFLDAKILRYPDLSRRPKDVNVRRELFRTYEELRMARERADHFDNISFGWALPKYANDDYLLGGAKGALNLNQRYEKGGHTHLTYEIFKRRRQWRNLIRRLSRGINLRGNYDPEAGTLDADGFVTDPVIIADLEKMRDLRRGQPLEVSSEWVWFEVNMWAGGGFQPIGRTVRGFMRYEFSNRVLAGISYHDVTPPAGMSWETMVEKKMQQRFQPLLAFQIFQGIFNNNDALIRHYRRLFKIYPNLEMVYVWAEDGKFYSVWSKGVDEQGNPAELARIEVPGNQILAQGKPENQNHFLPFVRVRHMQQTDENQDQYIGSAFLAPNIIREFSKDRDVVCIGVPEYIFTEDHNNQFAADDAHADRAFNLIIQPSLETLKGKRMNYGHPDWWVVEYLRSMGRMSAANPVNEDIRSGYDATARGKKIRTLNIGTVGKAREASFIANTAKNMKFGAGGTEQFQGRSLRDMRFGRIYGTVIGRGLGMLSHFYGGPGFYPKEASVVRANLSYALFLVFLGVSAFSAMPLEITLALIGIMYSQTGTFPGLVRLLFDYGLWGNIEKRSKPTMVVLGLAYAVLTYFTGFSLLWAAAFLLMIGSPGINQWISYLRASPRFQALVYTHKAGVDVALAGKSEYVGSGRSPEIAHRPLFSSKASGRAFYDAKGTMIESSHLTPALFGIVLSALGIGLYWNASLTLSWAVFLFFLSGYFVPLLTSVGGTPMDVGLKVYWEKGFRDSAIEWWKAFRQGGAGAYEAGTDIENDDQETHDLGNESNPFNKMRLFVYESINLFVKKTASFIEKRAPFILKNDGGRRQFMKDLAKARAECQDAMERDDYPAIMATQKAKNQLLGKFNPLNRMRLFVHGVVSLFVWALVGAVFSGIYFVSFRWVRFIGEGRAYGKGIRLSSSEGSTSFRPAGKKNDSSGSSAVTSSKKSKDVVSKIQSVLAELDIPYPVWLFGSTAALGINTRIHDVDIAIHAPRSEAAQAFSGKLRKALGLDEAIPINSAPYEMLMLNDIGFDPLKWGIVWRVTQTEVISFDAWEAMQDQVKSDSAGKFDNVRKDGPSNSSPVAASYTAREVVSKIRSVLTELDIPYPVWLFGYVAYGGIPENNAERDDPEDIDIATPEHISVNAGRFVHKLQDLLSLKDAIDINLAPLEMLQLHDIDFDPLKWGIVWRITSDREDPYENPIDMKFKLYEDTAKVWSSADKKVESVDALRTERVENIRELYNRIAQWYAKQYARFPPLVKDIETLLTLIPEKGALLDVGTGPGTYAGVMAEQLLVKGQRRKIYAIDVAEEMIEVAKRQHKDILRRYPDLIFEVMDTRVLTEHFKSQSMAGIVDIATFYRLPDPDVQINVLKQYADLLHTGGVLYLATQAGYFKGLRLHSKWGGDPVAVNLHSQPELIEMIREAGFFVHEDLLRETRHHKSLEHWVIVFASREKTSSSPVGDSVPINIKRIQEEIIEPEQQGGHVIQTIKKINDFIDKEGLRGVRFDEYKFGRDNMSNLLDKNNGTHHYRFEILDSDTFYTVSYGAHGDLSVRMRGPVIAGSRAITVPREAWAQDIQPKLRELIRYINCFARRKVVERIWIFGSVADGLWTEGSSDIDIFVHFTDKDYLMPYKEAVDSLLLDTPYSPFFVTDPHFTRIDPIFYYSPVPGSSFLDHPGTIFYRYGEIQWNRIPKMLIEVTDENAGSATPKEHAASSAVDSIDPENKLLRLQESIKEALDNALALIDSAGDSTKIDIDTFLSGMRLAEIYRQAFDLEHEIETEDDSRRIRHTIEHVSRIYEVWLERGDLRKPQVWILSILLHDIGKLRRLIDHELESDRMIREYSLLSHLVAAGRISEEERLVIEFNTRYHADPYLTFAGEQSDLIWQHFFNDSRLAEWFNLHPGQDRSELVRYVLQSIKQMLLIDTLASVPEFQREKEAYIDRQIGLLSDIDTSDPALIKEGLSRISLEDAPSRLLRLMTHLDNYLDTPLISYQDAWDSAVFKLEKRGIPLFSDIRIGLNEDIAGVQLRYVTSVLQALAWSTDTKDYGIFEDSADNWKHIAANSTMNLNALKLIVLLVTAAKVFLEPRRVAIQMTGLRHPTIARLSKEEYTG
ncbi:MAG: nucleotidyltransferase domain-containing protein, partial [Candidatus Omnitrophica bacterium]|nr:nucleotidyltransferase domain-containing protein [Candidatus Omnitrophota bacterium]